MLNGLAALGKSGFEGLLDLVGALSDLRAQLFVDLGQVAKHLHDRGAAAQVGRAPGLQSRLVLNGAERLQGFLLHLFQLVQNVCFAHFSLLKQKNPVPSRDGMNFRGTTLVGCQAQPT